MWCAWYGRVYVRTNTISPSFTRFIHQSISYTKRVIFLIKITRSICFIKRFYHSTTRYASESLVSISKSVYLYWNSATLQISSAVRLYFSVRSTQSALLLAGVQQDSPVSHQFLLTKKHTQQLSFFNCFHGLRRSSTQFLFFFLLAFSPSNKKGTERIIKNLKKKEGRNKTKKGKNL